MGVLDRARLSTVPAEQIQSAAPLAVVTMAKCLTSPPSANNRPCFLTLDLPAGADRAQ
jgi:hypothetical protein